MLSKMYLTQPNPFLTVPFLMAFVHAGPKHSLLGGQKRTFSSVEKQVGSIPT